MTAFLEFFGLTVLLVVGGVRGSLRLSTGRCVSSLRRSYAAPMHDTTRERDSTPLPQGMGHLVSMQTVDWRNRYQYAGERRDAVSERTGAFLAREAR